jgi:hypothetical protein
VFASLLILPFIIAGYPWPRSEEESWSVRRCLTAFAAGVLQAASGLCCKGIDICNRSFLIAPLKGKAP